MENYDFKKDVAKCAGLWLAEGSVNSKSEITFTNNCLELIDLFYITMGRLFKKESYNERIYIYSKDNQEIKLPYKDCIINHYIDKRATKPYFIFRIASVNLVAEWKEIVNKILENEEYYPDILRGFFAGEGNIKETSHNSRVLRIAQKEQKEFINLILRKLGIHYTFFPKSRSYDINSKKMWDIFAEFHLADLHPIKKEKFWRVYSHFKEEHYKNNFLKDNIILCLKKPITSRELAERFNRSLARIQDILIELKKQNKIYSFRIKSKNYWTNNSKVIMISKIKENYLKLLNQERLTSEFAKEFKVDWKSSFRRLKELEKLNLARRNDNGKWIKQKTNKKILVV